MSGRRSKAQGSQASRRNRFVRRNGRGLAIALALVLAGAGAGLYFARGSGAGASGTGASTRATGSVGTGVLASRGPAPAFALTAVNGTRVSLAGERGHPVILYFMAASCSTCLPEAAAEGRIQSEVRFEGPSGARRRHRPPRISPALLQQFIRAAGNPRLLWVQDRSGQLATAFKVRTLDTMRWGPDPRTRCPPGRR